MTSIAGQLRRLLSKRFDQEEIRNLCQDLHVDYDNLSGEGTRGKIRELITYYERRKQLDGLITEVKKSRPDLEQELQAILDDYHPEMSLELKLDELENKQPRILVGFQDPNQHLAKVLRIQLDPLPPEPDYDALVDEKQKAVLAKAPYRGFQNDSVIVRAMSNFTKPNPHYKEDTAKFLVEYHAYRVRRYECKIAADRTRSLVPAVENHGHYPATSVTLEFKMPATYTKPEKHQQYRPSPSEETLRELGFSRKEWQEWEDVNICQLPLEPSPTLSLLDDYASSLAQVPHFPFSPPEHSNTNGPIHEERNGAHYIVYTIENLIQHRPERDFDPFWFWLASVDHSVVWEIPVKIFSADLHTPQEETLVLEITVVEG